MIQVQNLTKKFGSLTALDDVSFEAAEGEVLGFLGPNGAGKSTTMNILTGYISSTSGNAKIDGIDILEQPHEAKKHIGYLPEQPPLYMDMTVEEYLNFVYGLKKTKLPKKRHIEEVCELVKITDVYSRLIRNLSKGYRQRTGLGAALIGNPGTLILDEPTVGLDPQQIIEIRALIKKMGQGHTLIFSSHILTEIQAVCDKIVIINHGKIAAYGTPESLADALSSSITVRVEGDTAYVKSTLEQIPFIENVTVGAVIRGGVYEYAAEPKKGTDAAYEVPKAISEKLSRSGLPVIMLKSKEKTLEDVFLSLVN